MLGKILDVRADRAHDLERQLRNPVAEARERQALEHDIRQPAIGRRIIRALLRNDQVVWQLILAAAMNPNGEAQHIERLAVRPDAADVADLAFAQSDREIGEI